MNALLERNANSLKGRRIFLIKLLISCVVLYANKSIIYISFWILFGDHLSNEDFTFLNSMLTAFCWVWYFVLILAWLFNMKLPSIALCGSVLAIFCIAQYSYFVIYALPSLFFAIYLVYYHNQKSNKD